MGFESTKDMKTKEFCGAPRPSKVLKRIERNFYCPLIAPKNGDEISMAAPSVIHFRPSSAVRDSQVSYAKHASYPNANRQARELSTRSEAIGESQRQSIFGRLDLQ